MTNFNEAFEKFIFQRTIDHSPHIKNLYKNYQEVNHAVNQLLENIKHQLPEEHIGLLLEFEESINYLHCLSEVYMYEQGMKDGICLSKYMFHDF